MALPCVLHLPDMGSVRITGSAPGLMLDYDARRCVKTPFVRIAFPPATAQQRHVEYRFEVVAIYPPLPGIEHDARYDGFRRDWLNIFQVNPRVQMLANNAASDACALYALRILRHGAAHAAAGGWTDVPRPGPHDARPLPRGREGLRAGGLRLRTDRRRSHPWKTPWTSLDSLPSLLIAACDYAEGAPDLAWAAANYAGLLAWAREMVGRRQ